MEKQAARPPRFDDMPAASDGALPCAFRWVGTHKAVFATAVLLGAVFLAVSLAIVVVVESAEVAIERMARAATISVVLKPSTQRADGEAMQARLAAIPGVLEARFVSREAALERMRDKGERLRGLLENPLPETIVLKPAAVPTISVVDGVRTALQDDATVQAIRYDVAWFETLDRWKQALQSPTVRAVSMAVLVVLALLFAGLWRLALNAERDSTSFNVKVSTCITLAGSVLSGVAVVLLFSAATSVGLDASSAMTTLAEGAARAVRASWTAGLAALLGGVFGGWWAAA